MKENWIPLEILNNFEEMLDDMVHSLEERVGWCLLCNAPIRSEADLIPESNTHNCEEGRAL